MNERLTRREVQCVRLAGEGLANKEIARHLNLAPRTVGNHLSNAYVKLGASDRFAAAEAVARDYPDYSRLSSILIASPPAEAPTARSPDRTTGEGNTRENVAGDWPLPRPPRGVVRLVLILACAALAAILVGGIVFMVTASLRLSEASAPPNAVRSI